ARLGQPRPAARPRRSLRGAANAAAGDAGHGRPAGRLVARRGPLCLRLKGPPYEGPSPLEGPPPLDSVKGCASVRAAHREGSMKRIEYAGSVHDEEEIEAVVAVLRGGPNGLRIGKNVKEMERLVAASFGKRRGVMVNSGSSALYLAVELLDLAPGDEIITSSVTFSTDVAPMVRAGLIPVFVDVEYDTYQID